MDSQINPATGKRKRGRPRKYKAPTSQEFVDVEARMSPVDFTEEGNSRSNLEDDLQYSSDDDDDLDVEDEEDWQEVDNENITVTVEDDHTRQFSADDQVLFSKTFFLILLLFGKYFWSEIFSNN